ncbi:MAG: hypothetical protein IJK00_05205 [Clostridia bacterium]|nr:hypothetical protein [Clostridia bacterium]
MDQQNNNMRDQQYGNAQPQQNQYNYGQNPYQYQAPQQAPNPQYNPQTQPQYQQPQNQQPQYQQPQYQQPYQNPQYYYAPVQEDPLKKFSTSLLVIGILLIIGSIINLISQASLFTMKIPIRVLMKQYPLAFWGTIIIMIGAIFQLIAGILGIVNRKKPTRMTVNIIMISIQISLFLIGQIMILKFTGFSGKNIFTVINSFFLPILYLVMCVRIKNAGKTLR